MKLAIAKLKSVNPYSQSRHYAKDEVPMEEKELHDAYERRTWRNRMHVTKDGYVFIPPMSFANCVKTAASRLGIKVPGQRNKTFTKSFEAGVMVTDPIVLPIKAADVQADVLFVPSDGIRGSGKRVTKYFPRIDDWEGEVTFYVTDDLITEDVFRRVLEHAGMLVGLGRFRPEKCGFFGTFKVLDLQWGKV
jgi:hypothetical protein